MKQLVAGLALVLLIVGSLAHQHASAAAAAPEQCTACALTQTTPDAPLALALAAPPPAAQPIDQALPIELTPRTVVVLAFAPKTSPPAFAI